MHFYKKRELWLKFYLSFKSQTDQNQIRIYINMYIYIYIYIFSQKKKKEKSEYTYTKFWNPKLEFGEPLYPILGNWCYLWL